MVRVYCLAFTQGNFWSLLKSGLWLAGNEGMEKNMETTIMGAIRNTIIRIHAFFPSLKRKLD